METSSIHQGDADTDLAAYKAALVVAKAELRRHDQVLFKKHASLIPASLRIRRATVFRAVEALEKLSAELGTH